MVNEDLEILRKRIYKVEYYFEKMKEEIGYTMALSNSLCYKFGGKSGVELEEEVKQEIEQEIIKENKGVKNGWIRD